MWAGGPALGRDCPVEGPSSSLTKGGVGGRRPQPPHSFTGRGLRTELCSSPRRRPWAYGWWQDTLEGRREGPLSGQAAFLPSWQLERAEPRAGVFVFLPQPPAPPPMLTQGFGSKAGGDGWSTERLRPGFSFCLSLRLLA